MTVPFIRSSFVHDLYEVLKDFEDSANIICINYANYN